MNDYLDLRLRGKGDILRADSTSGKWIMSSSQGFSLVEVLIALFLITTTSVGLLTAQWRITQLFNQAILSSQALIELDNNAERLFAGLKLNKTTPLFSFTIRQSCLSISWESASGTKSLKQPVIL